MHRILHLPRSLLGQIIGILLLTTAIDFGISTLLYERASTFAVQEDEVRRLAEHLVVANRLLSERPVAEREAIAAELTTDRYVVRWMPQSPLLPPVPLTLDRMRDQVVAWEPTLEQVGLRLRFLTVGPRSKIAGHLRLADGSWMRFETREAVRTVDMTLSRVMMALAPALAMAAIGSLLIRRTLYPLGQLADAAERIGRAHPEPVPERGAGEVRRLTRSFNAMQQRIVRLIDERTRALAAVGHDLRTPLARLQLEIEGIDDLAIRHMICGELNEMEVMIGSLLAFLGGEADSEPAMLVDVAVLCANLADDAQDRGYEAQYHGPDHLDRILRPVGFKRALVNLMENALHFGTRIDIRVQASAKGVVISIEDDGPGVPEEALLLVFEPFVRLDPARSRDTVGFGLGLSIVARAVAAEGGTVALENRIGGGLSAIIRLAN